MKPLTPAQEALKRSLLHELATWLEERNPRGRSLLKPTQVTSLLNISETTLSRLRRSGTLPAKRTRKGFRYTWPDVLELMDNRSPQKIKSNK